MQPQFCITSVPFTLFFHPSDIFHDRDHMKFTRCVWLTDYSFPYILESSLSLKLVFDRPTCLTTSNIATSSGGSSTGIYGSLSHLFCSSPLSGRRRIHLQTTIFVPVTQISRSFLRQRNSLVARMRNFQRSPWKDDAEASCQTWPNSADWPGWGCDRRSQCDKNNIWP